MADPKAKPAQQARTDLVDNRRGAYDPVSTDGGPQPYQVKEDATPHEAAQWGADARSEPLPGKEDVLPEGLKRPRIGPDHKPVEQNKKPPPQ